MAIAKSFMDCPQEVMTMIFKECTQGELLALMLVNKCLLDLASLTFYSHLHITVKDMANLVKSHQASSSAKKGTVCGLKWKEERLKFIQTMALDCYGRNYGQPFANQVSEFQRVTGALDRKVVLVHLRHLSFRLSWYPRPLAKAMLQLISHVSARLFCDASYGEDYKASGNHDDDMDALAEWLRYRGDQQPEILTLHSVYSNTLLWNQPGKVTRLCISYRIGRFDSVASLVARTAHDLANLIQVAEGSGNLYERKGDICWEIYQNGFDYLYCLFEGDPDVDPSHLSRQELENRVTRDKDITRRLQDELHRLCDLAKDRIKVFSAADTNSRTCEGCGRSMNLGHQMNGWSWA